MIAAEPISGGDAGLGATLAAANLPVTDIMADGRKFYRFTEAGETIGYGGLEPYGAVALLRSVVVTEARRGSGVGRQLTDRLMELAAGMGVAEIYLLTDTAEAFFRHLGFERIARSAAPEVILATEQAMHICASAALLTRSTT